MQIVRTNGDPTFVTNKRVKGVRHPELICQLTLDGYRCSESSMAVTKRIASCDIEVIGGTVYPTQDGFLCGCDGILPNLMRNTIRATLSLLLDFLKTLKFVFHTLF